MDSAAAPPASPAVGSPRVSAPKTRDWLIDNCRAVLIVLVVSGHIFMTYHGDTRVMAFLHYFVYLFHMPAFAFFSGYVITSPRRTADRTVHALLPLYLGMSVVHLVALRLFFGSWQWNIFIAPGLLWYLLALMLWRVALPRIDRLKHPIVVAFALSLLAGLFTQIGTPFALSRTIVFLPFFLMGFYCPREWRHKVRELPWATAVLALALIASVAAWLTLTKYLPIGAFTAYSPYGALAHFSILRGMASRFIMLVCSAAAIFALARLLPERHTRVTFVGTHSLSVYVLQMYFIYAFQVTYPHLGANHWIDAAVLLSPIPISLLLAGPLGRGIVGSVERIARFVLDPLIGRPTTARPPARVAALGDADPSPVTVHDS